MTTTALPAVPPEESLDLPRAITTTAGPSDRVFRGLARTAGGAVLLIMVMIGVFLSYRASEALREAGFRFFLEQAWEPDSGRFGVAALITGTVLIASVGIVIAFPLSLGTALYISEYSPRRVQRLLINLVDLMAAVPSVLFGLCGAFFLQPDLLVRGETGEGLPRWLATYFGWIPFLGIDGVDPSDPLATGTTYTSSTFIAGIVVALMVAPIATSIMREVFSQAPAGEREGAYALGATKWGMIRSVVLPFGLGGMIGGTMLGLGRALGETIAVFMIISPVFFVQTDILKNGAISISALIALRYGDATAFGTSALMAAGLTLFALTLGVNVLASIIVSRSRSGSVSDG